MQINGFTPQNSNKPNKKSVQIIKKLLGHKNKAELQIFSNQEESSEL